MSGTVTDRRACNRAIQRHQLRDRKTQLLNTIDCLHAMQSGLMGLPDGADHTGLRAFVEGVRV